MNTTEGGRWPEGVPEPGAWVRDTKRNSDAVVMAAVGTYVQIRPVPGGVERDVKPEEIRPLTAREELRARQAAKDAAARVRGNGQ